ncbi:hypothetical protein B296_00033792 [Ensete ventricosum]|uniref:Protein transport protein Sec61 subunit beta n=1 Tax=Ensete ventricosum TaxID=4639 RepID=A0A427A8S7_ENSVE|nr:hypothetical protein B296_00033792 [Ensete ventricosum]
MVADGGAPPRGSAAAAASMRRRRAAGGSAAAAGGGASTMLQFYTDDATGAKMSPNTVLFMSIGFIAVVALLHVVEARFPEKPPGVPWPDIFVVLLSPEEEKKGIRRRSTEKREEREATEEVMRQDRSMGNINRETRELGGGGLHAYFEVQMEAVGSLGLGVERLMGDFLAAPKSYNGLCSCCILGLISVGPYYVSRS